MPWIYLNSPIFSANCYPDFYNTCTTCDPYWNNVCLLLTGEGVNGGTVFTDTSRFNRTPAIVGNITTATNSESPYGSSIYCTTAVGYLEYTGDFAKSTDNFTFEAWVRIHSQNGIGAGYAYNRGIFFEAAGGGSLICAHAGMVGTDGYFTLAIPSAGAYDFARKGVGGDEDGMVSGYERHHIAFVRSGGSTYAFVDGRRVYSSVSSSAVDTLYIGSRNATYGTGVYVDSVRFTRGVVRYRTTFTPPTGQLPVCEQPSNAQPLVTFDSSSGFVYTTPAPTTWRIQSTAAMSSTFTYGTLYVRTLAKRYVEFAIQGPGTSGSNTGRGYIIGLASPTEIAGNPSSITNGILLTNFNYNGGQPGYVLNTSGFVANATYDFIQGDVIGMAIDHDTGSVWVRKNGQAWIGGGDPETGTLPTFVVANGWNVGPKCWVYHQGLGYTGDWQAEVVVDGMITYYLAPTGFMLYEDRWVDTRTVALTHSDFDNTRQLYTLTTPVAYGTTAPVYWTYVIGSMAPPVNGHTLLHMGQWNSNYVQPLPVKVYDVDVDNGTFTEVATFNYVYPGYPTFGEGNTDVSMTIQGYGTTVYTREGTTGLQRTFELPENLGSSQLRFARQGNVIVFGSDLFGSQRLYKFDVSTGALLATGSVLPTYADSIHIIGDAVYVASPVSFFVFKLDLATLTFQSYTKVPEDAVTSTTTSNLTSYNGNLVYVSSTSRSMYMLGVDDRWVKVGDANVDANVTADTVGFSMFQHNNDLVMGCVRYNTNPLVYQLFRSTASQMQLIAADSACDNPKRLVHTSPANVSTAISKFGKASTYVPNTGVSSSIGAVIPFHQDFLFDAGDFTIDCWAHRMSNAYLGVLFQLPMLGTFSFTVDTTGQIVLNYYTTSAVSIPTKVTFPLNVMNYIVVQRYGTYLDCYLNGQRINRYQIPTSTTAINLTGHLYIGRPSSTSAQQWNGYIDEFRVTKGVARYTPATTDSSVVSLVGVAEPLIEGGTVTFPAHNAGDMLIVFAMSSGLTIPSLPTGWTSIAAVDPGGGSSYRVMYILDMDNTITSTTFSSGYACIGIVYRGAQDIGSVALSPNSSGYITSLAVPSLRLQETEGSSTILTFVAANTLTTVSDPVGLTFRADNKTPQVWIETITAWDSAGGVTNYGGGTTTFSISSYATAVVIELKAARTFVPPKGPVCDAV